MNRIAFWMALASWILVTSLAVAQVAPDFDRFDQFAGAVETSLGNDRLPDSGLQSLRNALAEWRDEFVDARGINAVDVEALQAQIDALGPPPAEGGTESASVTERRTVLEAALQEALAPRLRADEAHARADALIRQIDSRIRARQTGRLFDLSRTPLDPRLWSGAVAAIVDVAAETRAEIAASRPGTLDHAAFWQRIVIAALFLIGAVVLASRGERVAVALIARVAAASAEHARLLSGYLLSFGTVLMALVGVSLLNGALVSTDMLGVTGRALTAGVNAMIATTVIGHWLGRQVFPKLEPEGPGPSLGEDQRARARALASLLGLFAGILVLHDLVSAAAEIDDDISGVLAFPVLLLTGIAMWRLGSIASAVGRTSEGMDPAFGHGAVQLLWRAVQAVAIVGPVVAVIGLQALASGIMLPSVLSLGLLALLISIHHALRSFYGLLRGLDAAEARQALVPVLASLSIALAALPVLALIWGARSTDLADAWTRFRTGVALGDSLISPTDLLTFALVFAVVFVVTRLVQGTLRSSVLPRTRIDAGGRNAIVSGAGYVGIAVAAVAGVSAAGIDLSSLAIVIGALGVGIGFGLQNIINNFVSGIILLIERPISEGDWVEVGGQMGIVRRISVRSTRIETFDRKDVIVPNGDLISGTVTNWTRGNLTGRVVVPVGVAYGTDPAKVERILREIAEAQPEISTDPAPSVIFRGFGADSMDFEIRAILDDINYGLAVRSGINHEIVRRFAEEDIEIPFAQRDVWLRNPETLASQGASNREATPPVDTGAHGSGSSGDAE